MFEQEVSPFLRREERRQYRPSATLLERQKYEEERAKARLTLEKIRYRRFYVNAVDRQWRIIQRTGNIARTYWPGLILLGYVAQYAIRGVW